MIWLGRALAPTSAVVILAGCASTQLNYNALDVASTIDDFYMQQVLTNLIKIKEHEYAIPAQVAINTGTISTSNQLTGTLSAPVSHAIAATNQLVSTISTNPSTANTVSQAVTRPNMNLTAGATNVATQQYIFWPIYSDSEQLIRLQFLYRYAARKITANELLCQYPVPKLDTKQDTKPTTDQKGGGTGINITGVNVWTQVTGSEAKRRDGGPGTRGRDGESDNGDSDGRQKGLIFVRDGGNVDSKDPYSGCIYDDHRNKARYVTLRNPDPAFLYQPICVLCDKSERLKEKTPYRELGNSENAKEAPKNRVVPLVLNEKLMPNSDKDKTDLIDWLYIVGPNENPPPTARLFYQHRGYSIYLGEDVRHDDSRDAGNSEKKFYDLMLFILEASLLSNQPTGGKGTPSRNGTPNVTANPSQ